MHIILYTFKERSVASTKTEVTKFVHVVYNYAEEISCKQRYLFTIVLFIRSDNIIPNFLRNLEPFINFKGLIKSQSNFFISKKLPSTKALIFLGTQDLICIS